MAGEIQALFNTYQQKHLTLNKNAIVDLMLKDGVISKETAKKIKSGVSLFLLDKQATLIPKKDETMTEIMGAHFSKKPAAKAKPAPKTRFNRKIEATFQSSKQGDCWLLSDVNAMNTSEWGRRALHDAIVPDKNGGVTIRFKGSILKQKAFHITQNEILQAKKSGYYAKGDDDMIALELATEKYSKMLEKAGLGKRITNFDQPGLKKSYIAGGGMYNRNGYTLDISELITGRKDTEVSFSKDTKVPDSFLKTLSQNMKSVAPVCTFSQIHDINGRAKDDPVHGNHAYAIKRMTYGKEVVLIDPYHADKEIKLSWKKFMYDVESITIASKDNQTKQLLESHIPAQLKKEIVESHKTSAQINKEQAEIQHDEKLIQKTFPEVAKILNNFGIPAEDVQFDKIDIKWNGLKKYMTPKQFQSIYHNYMSGNQPSTEGVNKDNVMLLLDMKPDFVLFLDKYKSGWGKGKEKKALISPIINALAQKAQESGVSSKVIEEFKKKCNKELDAIFYTDEKVLQQEVQKMVRLIKSKESA